MQGAKLSDQDMEIDQQQISLNKLYGRDSQLKELIDVCIRTRSVCPPELALVSGCSGSGKTSLVRTAADRLSKYGFFFLSGKFDQLQHAEPLSAIKTAFNQYFFNISKSDDERINTTRSSILETAGDCVGVLTACFPGLENIIGGHCTNPTQVGLEETQHRFEYAFRSMVKAIATPSNPVVLFLDDLHWADAYSLHLLTVLATDAYSLHLLTVLATDREIKNFLFIGCLRDDEVGISHPLAVTLRGIQNRHTVVTKITVANIDREEINALISETFHFPASITISLTDIVYQKTKGNALCITQFLQSLHDGGLLQWSSVSNSWEIQIQSIEAEYVPDDAVRMFKSKILQLPVKTQLALKLMSCVGSSCSEYTLLLFLEEKITINIEEEGMAKRTDKQGQRSEMLLFLNLAIHEGLVKKEGINYNFIHDQVQHAAYLLIPKEEKHLWHLRVGYNIWLNVPEKDEDKVIFIAVDQMNHGMSLIESEDKKIRLAKLNLRAGVKAMSLSTFSSCASYFLGCHQLSQKTKK
uniref:Orc1-like AAA ATPase domain-containing protein n=1 Tax=Ditylum brightwellii TaxID=49249 RepID=A0A6V2LRZ4_9STRA